MQTHSDLKQAKNNKIVLPNPQVVSSLFESYLTIRKTNWRLGEDQPIQLITSSNTANKIKTCIELLEQFQSAKTFNDWINVVYLCADRENNEKQSNASHWYSFLTKPFSDKPLLMLTIHAATAYMLSQLMNNDEFHQLKDSLQQEINALQNAITEDNTYQTAQNIIDEKRKQLLIAQKKLDALNMQEKYHHSYFLDIILPREDKAKYLDEQSFGDYEQHVISGLREPTICKMLLGYATSGQMQLATATKAAEITLPKAENRDSDSESTEQDSPLPVRAIKATGLSSHGTFAATKKKEEEKSNVEHARRYNLRHYHR